MYQHLPVLFSFSKGSFIQLYILSNERYVRLFDVNAVVCQLQEAPRAARDNTNLLSLNPCSSEQRDHNKYNNIPIYHSSSLLDMFMANGRSITD